MSEQEKNTGGNAAGGSVLVVKQTTSNRNKNPYRPNELEEDTDVHHKRSTAPAAPSVTELKDVPEDTTLNEKTDVKDRKESDRASDKHKHSLPKKLSSSTKAKRRDTSPESIPLKAIESGSKKIVQPQPIPVEVVSIESAIDIDALEKESENKGDEDSILDEVTMLRGPAVAKEHSEWNEESLNENKKGVSWNDKGYQQNVIVQDIGSKSQAWVLDRKASIGPCYRSSIQFGRPSGITICLPQKSLKCLPQRSGININVSRRNLADKSKSTTDYESKKAEVKKIGEETSKVNEEVRVSYLGFLKQKANNIHNKIKTVLNA